MCDIFVTESCMCVPRLVRWDALIRLPMSLLMNVKVHGQCRVGPRCPIFPREQKSAKRSWIASSRSSVKARFARQSRPLGGRRRSIRCPKEVGCASAILFADPGLLPAIAMRLGRGGMEMRTAAGVVRARTPNTDYQPYLLIREHYARSEAPKPPIHAAGDCFAAALEASGFPGCELIFPAPDPEGRGQRAMGQPPDQGLSGTRARHAGRYLRRRMRSKPANLCCIRSRICRPGRALKGIFSATRLLNWIRGNFGFYQRRKDEKKATSKDGQADHLMDLLRHTSVTRPGLSEMRFVRRHRYVGSWPGAATRRALHQYRNTIRWVMK